MKNNKCWYVLGLCLFMGMGSLFAQQTYSVHRMEAPRSGLPYVAVRLSDNTEVKMSSQAANTYIKDRSQFKTFVLVDGVYYLPSEQKQLSSPIKGKIQKQVGNVVTLAELENTYCAQEDSACRDFVYMVYLLNQTDNMRQLVNGAKDDFALALRNLKRLNIRINDSANYSVEKRQYQRLIGDNYDIAALRAFLEKGEFTIQGWKLALDQLCAVGQQKKLNKQQMKEVKKLAKRADKGQDAKDLPVIRLTNVDPFAFRPLIPAISCVEEL